MHTFNAFAVVSSTSSLLLFFFLFFYSLSLSLFYIFFSRLFSLSNIITLFIYIYVLVERARLLAFPVPFEREKTAANSIQKPFIFTMPFGDGAYHVKLETIVFGLVVSFVAAVSFETSTELLVGSHLTGKKWRKNTYTIHQSKTKRTKKKTTTSLGLSKNIMMKFSKKTESVHWRLEIYGNETKWMKKKEKKGAKRTQREEKIKDE